MVDFSIIIPCFNDRENVLDAVYSCFAQTYISYEIIFVDDGSTDGSYSAVEKNFGLDGRVVCLKRKNGGPSVARNFGIKQAKGQFLVFLDSDDLLCPEYLKTAKNLLDKHRNFERLICVMPFLYFPLDDSARALWVTTYKPPMLGFSRFCNVFKLSLTNCFPTSSLIFPRKIIDDQLIFDEKLDGYEDWDLWLRVACAAYSFSYAAPSAKAATAIRIRKGLSSNIENMKRKRKLAFQKNFSGTPYVLFQIPVLGDAARRFFVLCWKVLYLFKSHPNVSQDNRGWESGSV